METWDQENNCVQQKEGELLGWALNNLEIYNLWKKTSATPTLMVMVDTTDTKLQEETQTITINRQLHHPVQQTNTPPPIPPRTMIA